MSLDGLVIDAPVPGRPGGYGFDPKMGEPDRGPDGAQRRHPAGPGDLRDVRARALWSTRTVEEDPGAPFFNETTKYVVSGTLETGRIRGGTREIVGLYYDAPRCGS